jgi:hypothetical protein
LSDQNWEHLFILYEWVIFHFFENSEPNNVLEPWEYYPSLPEPPAQPVFAAPIIVPFVPQPLVYAPHIPLVPPAFVAPVFAPPPPPAPILLPLPPIHPPNITNPQRDHLWNAILADVQNRGGGAGPGANGSYRRNNPIVLPPRDPPGPNNMQLPGASLTHPPQSPDRIKLVNIYHFFRRNAGNAEVQAVLFRGNLLDCTTMASWRDPPCLPNIQHVLQLNYPDAVYSDTDTFDTIDGNRSIYHLTNEQPAWHPKAMWDRFIDCINRVGVPPVVGSGIFTAMTTARLNTQNANAATIAAANALPANIARLRRLRTAHNRANVALQVAHNAANARAVAASAAAYAVRAAAARQAHVIAEAARLVLYNTTNVRTLAAARAAYAALLAATAPFGTWLIRRNSRQYSIPVEYVNAWPANQPIPNPPVPPLPVPTPLPQDSRPRVSWQQVKKNGFYEIEAKKWANWMVLANPFPIPGFQDYTSYIKLFHKYKLSKLNASSTIPDPGNPLTVALPLPQTRSNCPLPFDNTTFRKSVHMRDGDGNLINWILPSNQDRTAQYINPYSAATMPAGVPAAPGGWLPPNDLQLEYDAASINKWEFAGPQINDVGTRDKPKYVQYPKEAWPKNNMRVFGPPPAIPLLGFRVGGAVIPPLGNFISKKGIRSARAEFAGWKGGRKTVKRYRKSKNKTLKKRRKRRKRRKRT